MGAEAKIRPWIAGVLRQGGIAALHEYAAGIKEASKAVWWRREASYAGRRQVRTDAALNLRRCKA